jgi:internalin A
LLSIRPLPGEAMLRTLAFALAVSGLCLCSPIQADDAEDKAVAFVEKLDGTVTRDEKAPGKPVLTVNLSYTKVTDAGLKELAALQNLNTLNLRGTQVTDAGLKELAPLKTLTTLRLGKTDVTDAGLKELAALKNLTTLGLSETKVTDVGLKELATLKTLTALHMGKTDVTDAGLKELRQALPNCQIVK